MTLQSNDKQPFPLHPSFEKSHWERLTRTPATPDGRTPVELEAELDAKRVEVIEATLKPLVADYLSSTVSAADFKRQIDGINKQQALGSGP